jgi:hypothetical protein
MIIVELGAPRSDGTYRTNGTYMTDRHLVLSVLYVLYVPSSGRAQRSPQIRTPGTLLGFAFSPSRSQGWAEHTAARQFLEAVTQEPRETTSFAQKVGLFRRLAPPKDRPPCNRGGDTR